MLCCRVAAEAMTITESAEELSVKSLAGLSYNKQYDALYQTQPLNIKQMVPKPDRAAQAQEPGATQVCGRMWVRVCGYVCGWLFTWLTGLSRHRQLGTYCTVQPSVCAQHDLTGSAYQALTRKRCFKCIKQYAAWPAFVPSFPLLLALFQWPKC
jgi:hypothetical protein